MTIIACATEGDPSEPGDDETFFDETAFPTDPSGKTDASSRICKWTNGGRDLDVTFKTYAASTAFQCYLYGGIGMIFGPETAAMGCAIGVIESTTQALLQQTAGHLIKLHCGPNWVSGRVAPRCEDVPPRLGSRSVRCV